MLKKFNVTDYEYVQFEKDSTTPHMLYIVQYDDPSYSYKEEIGRFDFFNNEGQLAIPNKGMKEFKRFSALLNNMFKHKEYLMWNSVLVEECKKAGKTKRNEEKKRMQEKKIAAQTEKANEYINKLNNKDEKLINVLKENFSELTDEQLIKVINNNFKNAISKQLANEVLKAIKGALLPVEENTIESTNNDTQATETNYTVDNRSFPTYAEAEAYCNACDFLTDMIEEVNASSIPSNIEQDTQEKEIFHLHKNTFDTYSDAYKYALSHRIPVTMIISSHHSSMTNERLQHLEKEYVFNKGQMSYTDMKEYFNYISSLPVSLDQDERYYKLKGYIERYEYKQQQKTIAEYERNKVAREACLLLHFMKKNGLILDSSYDSGISMTKYILNGQTIHTDVRSGGIDINKYYNNILSMFNTHFSHLQDEYSSAVYYHYKVNQTFKNESLDCMEPYKNINGYIYNENKSDHTLFCFDRPLTDVVCAKYNLTPLLDTKQVLQAT